MRVRVIGTAALLVLAASTSTALVLDDDGADEADPGPRLTSAASTAEARPGLTPVGFTAVLVAGTRTARLDDDGSALLPTSSSARCAVLPAAVWRTGQRDLVVRWAPVGRPPCGRAGMPTAARLVLQDGPVRPGTAVLRLQPGERLFASGDLLLGEDDEVPLRNAAPRDCGRTTVTSRRPVDRDRLACLVRAARAGTPAVLRVDSCGTDSGSADTYEVVGPGTVRLTHDGRRIGGLGSTGVQVATCVRVTGTWRGYVRTAGCS